MNGPQMLVPAVLVAVVVAAGRMAAGVPETETEVTQ